MIVQDLVKRVKTDGLWLKAVIVAVALGLCPACATKTISPSPGMNLHWLDEGDGDDTLVLIHGWSNTLHVWDDQIRRLSSTYRVIAVDLPGFGKSRNITGTHTMASFGRDVADVIRFLGLSRVILVGFSMGGPVSIETAKQIPDKVNGIVLVDVLQNPEMQYSESMIHSTTSSYMDAVTDPSLDKIRPFFKTHQDGLAERYMAMVKDAPKDGWKESLENCMHWMNDEASDSIRNLGAPIFSINSDQYPTEAALLRKLTPLYKVRVIQGVGHVVFWEAPDPFFDYLQEFIHDFRVLDFGP